MKTSLKALLIGGQFLLYLFILFNIWWLQGLHSLLPWLIQQLIIYREVTKYEQPAEPTTSSEVESRSS